MAFIELTHKDGYPMLFNVNQIESVKPTNITWNHSETLIVHQNVDYNVRESYMTVIKLIKKTSTIGRLDIEKKVVVE